MTEKKSRGQPKFEPTQDQRDQVKLMKALGIPEDRICKMITNPRTGKPVAPMTLARAFAAELEVALPSSTPWSEILSPAATMRTGTPASNCRTMLLWRKAYIVTSARSWPQALATRRNG